MIKKRPLIVLFSILLLMLLGCNTGSHVAVGKWKPEKFGVDLIFYEDGTAALSAAKATWQKVDGNIVKLQVSGKGEEILIEFEVTKDDKGELGILHFVSEEWYRRVR